MEPKDFNTACELFARSHDAPVPGVPATPWAVRREVDGLGAEHAILCATWVVPCPPPPPSGGDANPTDPPCATPAAAACCDRRRSREDVDAGWGDSGSDRDDHTAPRGSGSVAPGVGDGAASPHAVLIYIQICWSPTFCMPVAYFTAADAGACSTTSTSSSSASPIITDGAALRSRLPWLNVDGASMGSALITPTVLELTGRVAFMIHPCDVHTLFVDVLGGSGDTVPAATGASGALRAIRFVAGFAAASLRARVP